LAAALDRRLIVDAYIYGFGTVADGPVPPEHPWYVEVEAIPFDRDQAIDLLEQAGWHLGADGVRNNGAERLVIDLMTVGSGDAPLEQMIQAQLRDVGVDVRIHQFELTTFLARAQSPERDFDALVTGIPGDFSLGYVAAMFESTDPGPLAYPGYGSVDLDLALRRAREVATESELRSAWHEIQRILARDHPCTWLYHARGLQGANRRISHAVIDLRGELAGIADWRLGDTR
jgi:peptide/nickel transport system substrate-binding protein